MKNCTAISENYNLIGTEYAKLDQTDFGHLRRRKGEPQIHLGFLDRLWIPKRFLTGNIFQFLYLYCYMFAVALRGLLEQMRRLGVWRVIYKMGWTVQSVLGRFFLQPNRNKDYFNFHRARKLILVIFGQINSSHRIKIQPFHLKHGL